MKRLYALGLCSLLALAALLGASAMAAAADSGSGTPLFQIGQFDNSDAEFANAPDVYGAYPDAFPDDVTYVVGKSKPGTDWNYIHPGPQDGWAGSTAHTFAIEFNEDKALAGTCTLTIDLIGTHDSKPAVVSVDLNGTSLGTQKLADGTGTAYSTCDDQVEQVLKFTFDAAQLKAGRNTLSIANADDNASWIVYDAVSLTI